MRTRHWIRVGMSPLLIAITLAVGLLLLAGCTKEPAEETAPQPAEAAKPFDQSSAMIEAAADYLSADPGSSISAQDVQDSMVAGDPTYQIIDVRTPEHFSAGHIEGAINIPFEKIHEPANLEKLDPRKIVVIADYNGHDASAASMLLNMLGQDAMALRFGMAGWTSDANVVGLDPMPTGEDAGYPTVTTSAEATGSFSPPKLTASYEDTDAAITGQAAAYFASDRPLVITAADFSEDILKPGDSSYQILDVRPAEEYEASHIEGAINIVWTDIANTEKLALLDPQKKIAVYCQTGHTGADAVMFLNLMGYEAVDVEYGMCGWSQDPEPPHGSCFNPETVRDYATVSSQ